MNLRGALGHGGNYADIFTSALFSYRGYDFIVLANGRKKGTRGDATDLFWKMTAKLMPKQPSEAWLDHQLNTILSLSREYLEVPGIAGMVRFPDGYIWRGSVGIAKADDTRPNSPLRWTGSPMTPDLHFRIGSITKTITATAIMMLVQEKRLSLDDTLEKWLPGIIDTGTRVTIRQLLNHTSGIPDFIRNPNLFALNFKNPVKRRRPKERIAYGVPLSDPPQAYSYSNTGYILLALVAEKAAGVPYFDFVKEKIFASPGLHETTTTPLNDFSMPQHYAHGYAFNFNQLEAPPDSQAGRRLV